MAVKKQTTRSSKKPATERKSAKKVAARKTVAKKVVRKTASKRVSTTAKKASSRCTSTKAAPEPAPEVKLPNNMSQRAQAKADAIRIDLAEEWRKSFFSIAYVSGLCFVLLGIGISTIATFSGLNLSGQAAQVLTTNSLDPQVNSMDAVLSGPLPVDFQLTSVLPDTIESSERISFTVTNAQLVRASLLPAPCDGTTGFLQLDAENVSSDNYRVAIEPTSYAPGFYCFRVNVQPIGYRDYRDLKTYGGTKQIRIGPAGAFDTTKDDDANTADPTPTPTPAPSDDTTDDAPVMAQPSVTEEDNTIEEIDDGRTTFEPDSVEQVPEAESGRVFALFSQNTTLTGVVTIGVSVPDDLQFIELYARPTNSLNSRFVGLATLRFGRYNFVVNTPDRLPNGTYDFYAQGKNASGETFQTEPLQLRVSNPVQTTSNTADPITSSGPTVQTEPTAPVRPRPTDVSPVANVRTATNTEDDARLERELAPTPLEESVEEPDADARAALSALRENRSEVERLLQNYAAAQQTGDEILIAEARAAIDEKRAEIVNADLSDEDTRDGAVELDRQLTERLENVKERITRFEEVRRQRSEGGTALDTDGDGISDIDERVLYGTDPEAADSDNDGVADGIEIVRGFNPNSDEPEAVIVFESPRDSIGLVREDVLSIQEVVPVVPVDRQPNEPDVRTEIRGKALPNSFVTLYIFSTPIVVTVRTDADGSFVYTLDKELEDGEHDVFVAVTDNTGSIIAQSNPFSFVKEAQAFTPVDAAESEVVSNRTVIETVNQNSYGTVAGLGILALGLILIMLGISLRKRSDEVEMTVPSGDSDDDSTAGTPEDAKATRSSRSNEHIDAT